MPARATKTPNTRPPRRVGRPAHVPTDATRRQVRLLSGLGVDPKGISGVLGLSATSVRTHYRAEIEAGLPLAQLAVARSLYEQAVDGHTVACIFWLKARAQWSEQ